MNTTWTEWLVIAAIVGILAAVAIPAFTQRPTALNIKTEQGTGAVMVRGKAGDATLQRIKVEGVDCIVLVGSDKAALSCRW